MERDVKMKNKKGFTLVELLAVIVILAIILVIAVPKILTVIDDTRTESLKSSAKMIISSAEREYATRTALGTSTAGMSCADVASISSADYGTCTIAFNSGAATLTLYGADNGKFNDKCIIGATSASVTVLTGTDCP
jgi:type IV pilus assembly protein PilA